MMKLVSVLLLGLFIFGCSEKNSPKNAPVQVNGVLIDWAVHFFSAN